MANVSTHPPEPVWGEVNPWPFCRQCGQAVYRVGSTDEWRHRVTKGDIGATHGSREFPT